MSTPFARLGRAGIVAVLAAGALALTACSGPAPVPGSSANSSNGDAAATTMRVALVTHSAPGDTFWDIVRTGAEAAAERDGVELLYSADPDGARQAQLIDQAVEQKVDGIVVTLAKADAVADSVTAAVDAGIPVISINSGEDAWQGLGVLAHIGQNEDVAGEAAGTALNERGAKRAVCVIHEQGNVGHEARCAGLAKTFTGTSEVLYVNGADMTNVASTIGAKLQTNRDIDAVVTLGAPFAMAAVAEINETGSDALLATFDLSGDAVAALGDGRINFIIDQQPYLQGYEAVDNLWLYTTNGNVLGGGRTVLTGPQILTASDAERVAEYAARGTR